MLKASRSLIRPVGGLRLPTLSLSCRSFGSSSSSSSSAEWVKPKSSVAFPFSQFGATEEQLRSWPQAKVTTLPNGVRVASEYVPGVVASVGVYMDVGSRNDGPDARSAGLAHFSEHMLRASSRPFASALESKGAHLTTVTSRENTAVSTRVPAKELPLALEVLGSVLSNRSAVTKESVDAERESVISKMVVVDDNMEEAIYDRLHETSFRETSLARPILGTVENASSFSAQEIVEWQNNNYVGERMVLAAAGEVDHLQLVELAKKHLGGIRGSGRRYEEAGIFTGSELRIRHDLVPKAHAAIAFPISGHKDPDHIPLQVMKHMLGSHTKFGGYNLGIHKGQLLVRTLAREELAEKVNTFIAPYSDIGLFGVYVSMDWVGQHQLFKAVMYCFNDLSYNPDELTLIEAKNECVLSNLTRLNNTSTVSEDLGRNLLWYGRRIHPLETLQRVKSVNIDTVKNVAQRFFQDRDFGFAALGPIYELPDYNWLRVRTYLRRL